MVPSSSEAMVALKLRGSSTGVLFISPKGEQLKYVF
jgi:hypothetical protein